MATTVIDVTGLPEPVVQDLKRLVQTLRDQAGVGRADVTRSIFDLCGKAPVLRTREEIEAQLQDERDAWGEP